MINLNFIFDFFNLIRWKNLLMIVITQFIINYLVIQPVLLNYQIGKGHTTGVFFAILFSTIFIAAAGYLLNNLIDIKTDKINNKNQFSIDLYFNQHILMNLYHSLNIVALLIGIYPLIYCKDLLSYSLFPFAIVLLYYYSKYFKSTVLVGNFMVSLLTSLAILIGLFFERNLINEFPIKLKIIIYSYALFAFLVSMIREIVKDIEDMEGDFINEIITLSTQYGLVIAKKIALAFNWVTIIIILVFLSPLIISTDRTIILYIIQGTLIILGFISSYYIYISQISSDFKQVSKLLKLWMLVGILSMTLIPFYI